MNVYLHEKLTHSLIEEMASGQYREGQRFLSQRDIERIWRVSEPTVKTSLRTLIELGLVKTRPRSGHYLTADFHAQSLLLLHRLRRQKLPPPVTWQQRARQLQPKLGGPVALLLEQPKLTHSTTTTPSSMPSPLSPSVRRCAESFLLEAGKHGYTVTTIGYSKLEEESIWIRDHLEAASYCGVAVYCRSSFSIVPQFVAPLLNRGKPVVLLYNNCQGLPANSINLNNVGIGYDAVQQFIRTGRRHILVIADKNKQPAQEERILGAQLAIRESKLRGCTMKVIRLDDTRKSQPLLKRYLYYQSPRPLAIFACSSRSLKVVEQIYYQHPFRIPQEVALIGCSSRASPTFGNHLLDTMSLNIAARAGQLGVSQLRKIQAGEPLEKTVLINARYIKRQTT